MQRKIMVNRIGKKMVHVEVDYSQKKDVLPDDQRPYVNSREMGELIMMMCFGNKARQCLPTIKERAKLCNVKRAYSLWACAVGRINKAQEMLYNTIPIKSLNHMYMMSAQGEIVVRIKPTANHEHGQTVIGNEDMVTLINAAMHGECQFCLNEGRAAKECELRQVLQVLLPPDRRSIDDVCPYVHAGEAGLGKLSDMEDGE